VLKHIQRIRSVEMRVRKGETLDVHLVNRQTIPGLLQFGDIPEIAGLIAPRPILWTVGERDKLIDRDWEQKALGRMRRVYRALGAEGAIGVQDFPGGHEWNRKPGWPVAMGLAASVIFAVGIAWQLRPLQQAPVLVSAQAPVDETVQAQVMVDSPPGLASPAAEPAEEMAAADAAAPVQARVEQAPPAPAKALAAPAVGSRETLARQQAARAKTSASDGARGFRKGSGIEL
jgi:hypothetical protein